jgi:uncharacterized Tic20 family protein
MNESEPKPATPGAPSGPAPTQDDRTWGLIAHLSAFVFFLLPPIGGVLGPLIVWLARRDQSPFVATQAKEALNFNLSVLIAAAFCGLLVLVLIGFLLGLALFIAWIALTIIAAIKASEGVDYRYPVSLRLIK